MSRTRGAVDEKILVKTRMHWLGLANEILLTAAGLVALIIFLFWWRPPGWMYWLLLGAWVVACFRGVTNWLTSELTVTDKKLIFRRGLLSKAGWELPVDRVLDVAFNQTALQRLANSGSLLVESAGSARTSLTNVPNPEAVKEHIVNARDAVQSKRLDHAGGAGRTGASRAEQLDLLARLHAQGSLTDAEFESEKRRLLESD